MAIEYTMRAVCDQCGREIEPATKVKKSKIDSKRWEWERSWEAKGHMQGLPNLYGKRKLWCMKYAGT